MTTIVYAVIAITVLLVLLIIFTKNVGTPAKEIRNVSSDFSLTKCESSLSDRKCEYNACKEGGKHVKLYDSSCKEQESSSYICCDYS